MNQIGKHQSTVQVQDNLSTLRFAPTKIVSYPYSTSLLGRNIRNSSTDFGPTTGSQIQQSINVSVFCLSALEVHQICEVCADTVGKETANSLLESSQDVGFKLIEVRVIGALESLVMVEVKLRRKQRHTKTISHGSFAETAVNRITSWRESGNPFPVMENSQKSIAIQWPFSFHRAPAHGDVCWSPFFKATFTCLFLVPSSFGFLHQVQTCKTKWHCVLCP